MSTFGTAYNVLLTLAMGIMDSVGRFVAYPPSWSFVKSLGLEPLGFIDPTIDVYPTNAPRAGPVPRLMLPRPYDTRWNAGVSFLDAGPYGRDDRTVWPSGAQG